MNKEQAIETLKGYLPEYFMKYYSVDISSELLRCCNEQCGKEHKMSYDAEHHQEVCPDCGARYDIFDFIRIKNGLADNDEAFSKACEIYGIQIDEDAEEVPAYDDHTDVDAMALNSSEQDKNDRTEYFRICHMFLLYGTDKRGIDYLKKHSIGEETIKQFGLGFDPAGGVNNEPAIIIPNGYSYIAKSIYTDTERFDCYGQVEGSRLFNMGALTGGKPVFIVEDEFDVISCAELKMPAVALGSVDNVNQLLSYFDEHKDIRPKFPLKIRMNNDIEGYKASEQLLRELSNRNIPAHEVNIASDYKNISEAICADRETLFNALEQITKQTKSVEENRKDRDSYLRSSGSGRMQSFRRKAERNRYIAPIRTGFSKFDETLGGGLFSGLYIIGAISSLGKSALALQIADNIAKSTFF